MVKALLIEVEEVINRELPQNLKVAAAAAAVNQKKQMK
jgi:hypothetical protein